MKLLLIAMLFQISPELRQHIEAGMKAKAAGDWEGAAREFRRVTELAPGMAAGHVNLGAVLLSRREYDAAVPPLRRALELNADLPGAQGMLGTALLARGYACDSIPYLEKGKLEDLLGVALLECGRPREALDRLEASLEKRPEDPDLLYYVGQAHAQLARTAVERLSAAAPGTPRAAQALGEAQAAAGNRAAAEKLLNAALAARPDLRGAHLLLGELELQAGEYEKARVEFAAEAAAAPGSAVAAFKHGFALAQLGQTAAAIRELRRANQLQPGMPETLFELGKALHAAGDSAGAAPYLEQALKEESESALAEAAHFQLAQVYRALGRGEDAARETKAFQALRAKRNASR